MTEDEAYMLLQAAIIERAATDYRLALINDNRGKARKIERFFLSEWGQALTRDNGEMIIARIRKDVKGAGEE